MEYEPWPRIVFLAGCIRQPKISEPYIGAPPAERADSQPCVAARQLPPEPLRPPGRWAHHHCCVHFYTAGHTASPSQLHFPSPRPALPRVGPCLLHAPRRQQLPAGHRRLLPLHRVLLVGPRHADSLELAARLVAPANMDHSRPNQCAVSISRQVQCRAGGWPCSGAVAA